MNERLAEVKQTRAELLARIEDQREQMAVVEAEWQEPLTLVGQGVVAVRFLRRHPWLIGGLVAAFAVRRRSVAGLGWGVWRLWKGFRDYTSISAKLPSRD